MAVVIGEQTMVRDAVVMPLVCEECRADLRLLLPMPVRDLSAMLRAFEDAHAECLLDKREVAG
jgi:hypothetical protein